MERDAHLVLVGREVIEQPGGQPVPPAQQRVRAPRRGQHDERAVAGAERFPVAGAQRTARGQLGQGRIAGQFGVTVEVRAGRQQLLALFGM
ncbi:hypothetical protein [Amycolatopsis sp. YIM 10]|uniref:hypothetical protein n=1 Tax=Amycolatopsis sp. YIM 10 TaxID=2653857 RepID=UPI001290538B|nr:hypothetical protein [Amycolatopsis sp. YIM 10]